MFLTLQLSSCKDQLFLNPCGMQTNKTLGIYNILQTAIKTRTLLSYMSTKPHHWPKPHVILRDFQEPGATSILLRFCLKTRLLLQFCLAFTLRRFGTMLLTLFLFGNSGVAFKSGWAETETLRNDNADSHLTLACTWPVYVDGHVICVFMWVHMEGDHF